MASSCICCLFYVLCILFLVIHRSDHKEYNAALDTILSSSINHDIKNRLFKYGQRCVYSLVQKEKTNNKSLVTYNNKMSSYIVADKMRQSVLKKQIRTTAKCSSSTTKPTISRKTRIVNKTIYKKKKKTQTNNVNQTTKNKKRVRFQSPDCDVEEVVIYRPKKKIRKNIIYDSDSESD
eukprot:434621_1